MLELLLTNYSWYELIRPHWLIVLIIVSYFYIKKVVHSHLYDVTKKQKTYFFTAIILLALVQSSPIAVIANDYLFSAHVFQLSIFYFVVIPLFILSLPVNFLRKYVWHYRTKRTLKLFAHPWLNLIVFNGLLTIYFIPSVFNVVHWNVFLSLLTQIILTINAFLMWWVIINPVPELSNLQYLMRAAYIFFASLALIPIGFYFIIVQEIHFPIYEAVAGHIIPVFTSIYDQQLAGGLLKLTQMTSYVVALLFILLSWARKEEAKEGQVDDKNIRIVQGVVIHLKDKDKT